MCDVDETIITIKIVNQCEHAKLNSPYANLKAHKFDKNIQSKKISLNFPHIDFNFITYNTGYLILKTEERQDKSS